MMKPTVIPTLIAALFVSLAAHAVAAPLDDQIAAFSKVQSETAATTLLKTGLAEHRSAEALAAVQSWLNRNHLKTQSGLFYAARAADLSGQWIEAIGYYQRFLQAKGVDRTQAGVAADATYRLLVGSLRDDNAAYLLMRKDGNRLRGFGRARQYDRWFIEQAKTRADLIVLCDRLATILNDRTTNAAMFVEDLQWVAQQYELFRKETASSYEAAKRLAAAAKTPPVYKARLQWVATVMPYNFKLDELRNANAPAQAKLSDAPLAAAAQLLKLDPDRGAILVAQGWGVEYDHRYSGNCQKRFDIHGKRKLEQLLAVVPRMSPDRRDDMLAFPIAQNRVRFDPAAVRKLVLQYPEMLNSLGAANVPLFDKSLTVDEARKLAPQLARNPHPHAAMVRAFAISGEHRFSVLAEAMSKSEMWRFDKLKPALDSLWNSGVERDADYKKATRKLSRPDASHDQLRKNAKKKVASKDRLAAFAALLKDLFGAAPKIRGGLTLFDQFFANAPDADKVQMLKSVLTRVDPEREFLLQRALASARFAGNNPFRSAGPVIDGNWEHYHHARIVKALPELATHLQGLLQKQLKAGALSEQILETWLRCVDPKTPQARAAMKTMLASPAYRKLNPAYHRLAAHQAYFGLAAITPEIGLTDSRYISRELLALGKDASVTTVHAALKTATGRISKTPARVAVIGLQPLAELPALTGQTRAMAFSLFADQAPDAYPTRQGYEELGRRLVKELRESGDFNAIEPYAAGLWRSAYAPDDNRQHRLAHDLIDFAEAAQQANAPSAALSIARIGLKTLNLKDKTNDLPKLGARLWAASGKASIAIGLIDIPVDEQDPTYSIYKSQAEFALGNVVTAWDLYDKNSDKLQPIIRKMTVGYCLWLLERNIEYRDTERAEALVKELTIWSRQATGTFTRVQDAELKIAYADIAFQKGALQTARAWYRRVADADEHKGSELQYTAILRSVKVDRVARNFDSALADLDKLILVRNDDLRTRAHFARAEVLFDQEKYADSYDEIAVVLKRQPNHADALILMGKTQLEMRKLVDASEIELGVSRDQKLIVPGETIKINLSDPTLSISGVSADIEVEIWSASGDRERVMLHQLGDDKTKFRAEVPTRLAEPRLGDKVLQVLGRDHIRYGYSKRFRAKMTDLPPDPQIVIGVASDARLDVSAGAFPAHQGERKLNLEELGVSTAQQALGTRTVRPGNPVYVRVSDPDQSKTANVDQIVIDLQTSSGDIISQLTVKETGTHTGEFEAIVPTTRAQALAYASESAPGRNANMAISANPYPGWAGEVGTKASEVTFTIDLNDNVPLDKMTVHGADPEQALTHFVVQTSMNGRDWITRARYPDNPAPWDGRPRISSFPTSHRGIAVSPPRDRNLPDDWLANMETESARESVPYNAITVAGISSMNVELPSGGHPGYPVMMRYRAVFYQPAAAIRTFHLTGFPAAANTQTIFLLDGKPAEEESADPLTIKRELRPGLHEIQVWRNESRAELVKRKPALLCDQTGRNELVPCPDSMFDPNNFPAAIRRIIAKPATIKPANGDATQLDIAFGVNTRARLIRLAIVGHKGTAPAINKITLTDRQGKKRLPVATDYQQLRSNQQLEVVPGDQVTVRYNDDRVVTERRVRHERRLGVAYNTATIIASFLRFETTEQGQVQILEDIRRFKMNDRVAIVISDPDMDQSPKRDRLAFKVNASDSEPVAFEALETDPHSGVFIGRVFPVSTKPERASEIRVPEGGTLTATYRDMENLNPGIPTDRSVTIEHALYTMPKLAVYDLTSQPLPPATENKDDKKNAPDDDENGPEIVKPRRSLHYAYLDPSAMKTQTPRAIIGASLRFDVLASHLAFAKSSGIAAYVQTDAARRAYRASAGSNTTAPFDVRVPGTLKLAAHPSATAPTIVPLGYEKGTPPSAPSNRPALDEGRFSFTVPLILDDKPSQSYATEAAESLPSSQRPEGLAVREGDSVLIGYAYKDRQGKPQWHTATVTLTSHAFLDVMNGSYRRDLSDAYVGEKLYVRLIAPGLDRGPERDVTSINIKAQSGTATVFALRETFAHSGVFKGSFALSYSSEPIKGNLPSVELNGFPVKYGDLISVSYGEPGPDCPPALRVAVNKGADGFIEPFSKRYTEDAVAIKTTFTLAECFFELAKHHRKMEQESLARREMSHAQKLLAEAIAMHRDDELRAHAEYLLGNLAQESADLSKNEDSKKVLYQDALARFSKIPLDYPKAEFAPKAQFKKALVYEKMGELDIAVEEYVKLAYKYPDNELIPMVMSRLGAYFQELGLGYKTKAEELEKKEGDTDAAGEAIRQREMATKEYLNSAVVFAKLEKRFPDHSLAGLAGLRSAQNYMRAGHYLAAVKGFGKVIDTEQYDGKKIRAQAIYWCGISQERLNSYEEAYKLYRRATFDFPDSLWAKHARGRLADPVFATIIEKEEKERQILLESLKKK